MFCDHNHHQGAGASTGHLGGNLKWGKEFKDRKKWKRLEIWKFTGDHLPFHPTLHQTAAGRPRWCHHPKNKKGHGKISHGIKFCKNHLHIEALWCVTLIDSGPVEWEPDSLVIIRKFWISTIFLEVKKTPIWPKVLPGGQVQPVHNRWTSVFSELCVSWSWTVQCCHPVPLPGRSTKMQSQKTSNPNQATWKGFSHLKVDVLRVCGGPLLSCWFTLPRFCACHFTNKPKI